jgi:undecaprenyl-diphosphatase
MIDWLYSIDLALFRFINITLANPVSDIVFPFITDYDKQLPIRVALVATWFWLMIRGGKRGRTAALLLIPLLLISDQLSSSIIKPLVGRLRPCQGFPPEEIHLLVGCGGLGFPSSHAVNNFGVATMFAMYFPKIKVWLYTCASLVALSRIVVGVHYPADIVGGALIGIAVALLVVNAWLFLSKKFFPQLHHSTTPILRLSREHPTQ